MKRIAPLQNTIPPVGLLVSRNNAAIATTSKNAVPRIDATKGSLRHVVVALIAGGLCSSLTMNQAYGQEQKGGETKSAQQEIVIPEAKPGEEDFDKAIRLRINIDSLDKLREVIKLTESALSKGLEASSEESAKKFLASAYKQRVELSFREMSQRPPSRARTSKMLGEFLDDLSRSIELDPTLAESYLIKSLILRERQEFAKAIENLDEGIQHLDGLLKSNGKDRELREKLAKLYAARAGLRDDGDEEQLTDLEKSLEINPTDINITKQVVLLLESQQKYDKILAILDRFLDLEPDNVDAIANKIRILLGQGNVDEALVFSSKCIDTIQNDEAKAILLRQRSLIYQVQSNEDPSKAALAKADLDASLLLAKDNVQSILQRARLSFQMDDIDAAKKDIDSVLELDVDNPEAVLLRAEIAAETKKYDEAIKDYQSLLGRVADGTPQKEELLLKMSLMYWQSDRQKQALRIIDQVIRNNDDNWQAHRLRGEVLLSTGDHMDAVVAYEKALRMMPPTVNSELRSSLLNNLSWLLATSPDDDVRDGERSLELGKEACELTEYGAAHILSTLAAAYAETGNFEKAIEFSQKAVDLGKKEQNEQTEQLEQELKSYQEKKPWREKKEKPAENKPVIPVPPGAGT